MAYERAYCRPQVYERARPKALLEADDFADGLELNYGDIKPFCIIAFAKWLAACDPEIPGPPTFIRDISVPNNVYELDDYRGGGPTRAA